jgi:hypothetical protein
VQVQDLLKAMGAFPLPVCFLFWMVGLSGTEGAWEFGELVCTVFSVGLSVYKMFHAYCHSLLLSESVMTTGQDTDQRAPATHTV